MEPSVDALLGRYFPERQDEIQAFAHFLATAGIERGLIGPREGERIWDRHIFNCLPVTQLLPEGTTLFDIGSGAGLPGIVIALARPDIQVTLIEPLERRIPERGDRWAQYRGYPWPRPRCEEERPLRHRPRCCPP